MQASPIKVPRRSATSSGADPRLCLDALRRKDSEAHARLFRAYYQRVLSVLQRLLGSDPDLRDIAQDVFLVAFKTIDKFRGTDDQLEAWLVRIAVFRGRELIRRRRTRRRFVVFGASVPDVQLATVARPEDVEAVQATYRVLDHLPTDERIALVLRTVDGMTVREVAEVTGVSESTAKRRIRAGRGRFERLAAGEPALSGLKKELRG